MEQTITVEFGQRDSTLLTKKLTIDPTASFQEVMNTIGRKVPFDGWISAITFDHPRIKKVRQIPMMEDKKFDEKLPAKPIDWLFTS